MKYLLSCQRPLTLSAPASAPVLAVCKATGSVPKQQLLSPRASRATSRCNRSSRPPGFRTSSRVFAFASAPIDKKASTPPRPTCVRKRTRSLSEHIPCFALQNLPALAHKRTHIFPSLFPHPRDAALHRAPRGPRSRPPVGRLGRACARAHLSSLRPLRHSLQYNNLNDEAKQAVKDAAGSGVSITF